MWKLHKHINTLVALILMSLTVTFVACNDDDDASSATQLLSYGPSPALRGGELKFIGLNLDKVSAIVLPGNPDITEFKSSASGLIVIEVPQATVAGKVALKLANGDLIEAKTLLAISEPISITSFTPEVRAGGLLTISGTYLSLVTAVTLNFNQVVEADDFVSQTASTITLNVPPATQTGKLMLQAGDDEDPILIESTKELIVTTPKITGFTPNPIKPGAQLTITGTNLDLAIEALFSGGSIVDSSSFVSASATQIKVNVPSNINDGKFSLKVLSSLTSESFIALTAIDPTITSIAPNPVKNGGNIVITGTDLDLVTSVTFGGGSSSTPSATSATELTVEVPSNAVLGTIRLNMASTKTVVSNNDLEILKPSITTFSPSMVFTANSPSITISGANLDLVTEVVFPGAGGYVEDTYSSEPSASSAASLTVAIPQGAITGPITLMTTNGSSVTSLANLKIVADVPNITSMPASSSWGLKMIIQGTNMDVDMDIYFPGGFLATKYGKKSSTMIEVFVPADVEQGVNRLAFVTDANEVYWSPEFEISGITPLVLTIFDEGFNEGYGDWSWGPLSKDAANTEQAYQGSISWKMNFDPAGAGAMAFGGGNTITLSAYKVLAVAVYGGPGTNGNVIELRLNDSANGAPTITVVEGAWTEFEIPIAQFPASTMSRLDLFMNDTTGGVVYVDKVGFK